MGMGMGSNRQPQQRIAYLGPPTSYTHQTTLNLFSEEKYELTPQVTIKDVFSVVQNSQVSFGVIPFENSSNGSVLPTVDLLIDREKKFGAVQVCGEAYLPIRHCLLGYVDPAGETQALQGAASTTDESGPRASRARPEADLRHITRILSHPQAFGQCEIFLSTYLKGVECQEVSSTSKAAQMAAEDPSKTTAAISSSLAANLLGLSYLAHDIQDREDNTTRFFVLRKGPSPDDHMISPNQPMESFKWKTMVSFDVDHCVSGALADALSVFKTFDLNLTSINSRPSRLQMWHYKFLIEFEGKKEADKEGPGNKALAALDKITSGWRWVGSWVDQMDRTGA
ncbi:prephenate dehydratase [Sticta canariensis]|nr:prephenate dehydratase [Sticta canariensis]